MLHPAGVHKTICKTDSYKSFKQDTEHKLNEIDIGYKCGIFFSVCVSRLYKSILLTYITCRAPIEIQPIMTHFYYRRGSIPCTQCRTGIRRSAKIGVMLCETKQMLQTKASGMQWQNLLQESCTAQPDSLHFWNLLYFSYLWSLCEKFSSFRCCTSRVEVMTKNVTNVTFQVSKKIAATVAAAATDRQRNSFITFKSQPIVEPLEKKTTVSHCD